MPIILVSLVFFLGLIILLGVSLNIHRHLKDISRSVEETYKSIGNNLSAASNMFGDVQRTLGRLEEANKHIYEIGKNISTLQELLRAPKFRGKMGETLLENLLAQVIPQEFFFTQYKFKTQEAVDAVIKLGSRLVPIDAKFPLENFLRMQETAEEQAKSVFRKKFIQDVKARIDEIAQKYILPDENTYDFAMMYIPAENVYYEIIIKEDILSYALSKKVIPVSPNTFYAYLQVICLGLKGLKVEENAAQILKNLSALAQDLNKFQNDFSLVGNHLRNALSKHDEAAKRLERFCDKLTNIQEQRLLEEKQ